MWSHRVVIVELESAVSDGLNDSEIEDRFWVRGRMEILNVLNDLIHRREPVAVTFGGGTPDLPTKLLEARKKTLIFELSNDIDAKLHLLKDPACFFLARPEGICVQFQGGLARRISWGGSAAFSIPFPERLARLQRQESFRILIPAKNALAVRLFSNQGVSLGEWPLHDLSVGGLGVTVNGPSRAELGRTIARVNFLLPDHGEIDCAVILRHATDLATDEPNSLYRIGVAFAELPSEMRAAIQRYIIKAEHERRSLATEYDADDSY